MGGTLNKKEYKLTPLEVGQAWKQRKGPFVTQDAVDMQFDKVWPLVEQLQVRAALWRMADEQLSEYSEAFGCLVEERDAQRAVIEELKTVHVTAHGELIEHVGHNKYMCTVCDLEQPEHKVGCFVLEIEKAIRKASDLLDTNSACHRALHRKAEEVIDD